MINFDRKECNSIKSIAVQVKTNINVKSRFINAKMLMFAKISLKSFVYDMIDVFFFPTEGVKLIYDQYKITKCQWYLNLTDMDSCS